MPDTRRPWCAVAPPAQTGNVMKKNYIPTIPTTTHKEMPPYAPISYRDTKKPRYLHRPRGATKRVQNYYIISINEGPSLFLMFYV